MTNKKSTKRALLMSALSLLMCVSMLIGSTFAWFTDSVTSGNNKIVAGTLQIDLELLEKDGKWTSIKDSGNAIFDYENWEPGYTDVKILKVTNEGSLALKWIAKFVSQNELSELADVIDVYVKPSATEFGYATDRTDLSSWTNVGTVAKFVNTISETTYGNLKAGESAYLGIALKMQESAGNKYQGMDLGGAFDIMILATQLTSETDSFDDQYDVEAAWDGQIPTEKPESLVVDTEKKIISINDTAAFAYLNTLVNDANFYENYGSKWHYTIELNTDVNLFNKPWTPIMLSNFVAFNGNGHTISNLYVSTDGNYAGLFADIKCNDIGVTYVRDLTIDGAYVRGVKDVGVLAGASTQGAIENVTINNATVIGTKYVGGIFGWGNGSANGCTVKNSTISIENVIVDEADGSIDSKEAGGLIGYLSNDGNATTENKVIANNTVENVTIKAPSVASGLVSQPNSSNKGGAVIEIKNNTMKNVKITTTHDASADLYVSNNVSSKSIVSDNDAVGCEIVCGASDAASLTAAIIKGGKVVLASDITVDKWVMFSETKTIGNGKIITVEMNGLTIDGNGHTLTVNSIESAGNGNLLFDNATNLNISNLTIKYADGLAGGINLKSGVISNVTFIGGGNIIYPGTGEITVENCTFIENGAAFYNENETNNLTVTGCTFNLPDDRNVILIRGDVKFTNNTINSGRTVNIVSGSPVVTGNNFNNVRLKVYSAATATVSDNTINNLVFETTTYASTFTNNTMSADAQAALNAASKIN